MSLIHQFASVKRNLQEKRYIYIPKCPKSSIQRPGLVFHSLLPSTSFSHLSLMPKSLHTCPPQTAFLGSFSLQTSCHIFPNSGFVGHPSPQLQRIHSCPSLSTSITFLSMPMFEIQEQCLPKKIPVYVQLFPPSHDHCNVIGHWSISRIFCSNYLTARSFSQSSSYMVVLTCVLQQHRGENEQHGEGGKMPLKLVYTFLQSANVIWCFSYVNLAGSWH